MAYNKALYKFICLLYFYFHFISMTSSKPMTNVNKGALTQHRRNVCLLGSASKKHRHDLDIWFLTLETFSAMPTYMIYAKSRWNSSIK